MDKSNTLLLDVGNLLFFKPTEFEFDVCAEKNNIIVQAMNQMGYDAINLAPNDIFPDISLLKERCQKANFSIISANTNVYGLCENKPVQKYIIKEINGIRIGITGVMPIIPQNLLLDKRFHIEDPKTALNEIIPALADKTDYIILLSGFSSQDTLNLLTEIPAINLGLCIESTRLPLPITAEDSAIKDMSPSIMNVTIKGMELGILKLVKKDNRVFITDAEQIYLDQKVKSDEEMLKLSQGYQNWEFARKNKKASNDKGVLEHQQLMKNLELSPEEFFNQLNKSKTEE